MPAKPKPAWLWPVGVVGILLVSLSVCAITVFAAVSDDSFAIEDDYYARAVAWDDTAAQLEKNEQLGWTATAVVRESGPIEITLLDAAGEPITGALVNATVFHHAARRDALDRQFTEAGDGVYTMTLDSVRSGLWQIRLTAQADGERFTAQLNAWSKAAP